MKHPKLLIAVASLLLVLSAVLLFFTRASPLLVACVVAGICLGIVSSRAWRDSHVVEDTDSRLVALCIAFEYAMYGLFLLWLAFVLHDFPDGTSPPAFLVALLALSITRGCLERRISRG